LRDTFFDLQQRLRPDLFVEVGAYDGDTSIRMRTVLPQARIVAFEANPFNHRHFLETLEHGRHDVEFVHSAIAEENGMRSFKLVAQDQDGRSKKSSILQRHPDHAKASSRTVDVPCTSLDAFFAGRMPGRASLWIDVEGASREVLLGARRLLSVTQALLIEVEEQQFWEDQWLAGDVIRFLDEQGFKATDRDQEYPRQYNILFTRDGT
jgi:FkbM family methyltransferase